MLGLTETISIITADLIVYRGVETVDWTDPEIEEGIPAATDHYGGARNDGDGPGSTYSSEVRVILEPREISTRLNRIRWRGEDYTITEPPATHYRHGQPHHMSVPLATRA